MAKKPPESVEAYLAALPEDRREALEAVRKTILKSVPKKIEEGIQYGMIGYYVPHRVYPNGYHCDPSQPLPYIGLASQKNYMSLYLMCLYIHPAWKDAFESSYRATGKRMDIGACCVRFKKLEDLPLDVVGKTIQGISVDDYIAYYEANLKSQRKASKKTKKAKKG
ncbi:MAG: DUF1801 domain-containing protein [Pirellula sp.]|jgi:hypothetical protein|nr:DUF1801 domain-containing protein [Pirellula sp.]